MPPTEPPPPADLEIAVPMKNRREDWRTWGLVLLASKIRRCTSGNDLAALLGANEQNLERAVSSLAPADREDMERVIAEQWQKLPA